MVPWSPTPPEGPYEPHGSEFPLLRCHLWCWQSGVAMELNDELDLEEETDENSSPGQPSAQKKAREASTKPQIPA